MPSQGRRHRAPRRSRALVALALASPAAPPSPSSQAPSLPTAAPRAAPRAKAKMITDPRSRSLILRATRILVATITSTKPGPWSPLPPNAEERRVTISLKLDEVVKGPVTQHPGDVVDVDVRQEKTDVPWGPLPGVWSNHPIDPSTRVIAFGKIDSKDAAVTFGDNGCEALLAPEEALADVHIAAKAEAGHLDLAHLLALARPAAGTLGAPFADYLWARHEAEALSSPAAFDSIASFMEEPALGHVPRTTLVMNVSTAIDMAEPPVPKQANRFAVTLFRLVALPEAARLHDNLVSTYLPNLLGLGSADARRPEDVFHDLPADRAKARTALQQYRGPQSTAALLSWIGP
ncbi:hypothetical protein A7982_13112 [Minicystis rosea]|nr:hypothetical protein A7982_13112 [Minicystis rosea]